MSAKLPPPAHAKLVKLVKLAGMLGSAFDGERANAARMATDLLREYQTTWAEQLTPSCQPCPKCAARAEQEERSRAYRAPRDWSRDPWRTVAVRCLIHEDLLSEWEASFLQSIPRQRRQYLSNRQREVLDRIADRVWEATRA
jgi:hypothetical protein